MLQLWDEERFLARFHTRQIGYGCRVALPPTVRRDAFTEGHELGYFALAAFD